ncbi:hypothetical protein LJC24_00740 [Desulfococcaceae bacterium OttesenSCG-928-F15]|nr:hypothetical protein [Desulfococcaceae bacterium OttesenSCG-928-F15]
MHHERHVIFLSAGRPGRGSLPAALYQVEAKCRTLDWLMACFQADIWSPHIVLGYQADTLAKMYPELVYSFNTEWENSGAIQSLFLSPFEKSKEAFVSYTDILYSHEAISEASKAVGDIVVLVDSLGKRRFENRTSRDIQHAEWMILSDKLLSSTGQEVEFVGLALFRRKGIEAAQKLWKENKDSWKNKQLGCFITALAEYIQVAAVDIQGNWAELNAPQDLARFVLGTKAHTLSRLSGMVQHSVVPPHETIILSNWQNTPLDILDSLQKKFAGQKLAVRSSCQQEDTWESANAGRFTSLLNVAADDRTALSQAITEVIQSYGQNLPDDEVLIQAMVHDVQIAGVVFTRSLERGAPYRIINYDTSGKTDQITGGHACTDDGGNTLVLRKKQQIFPTDMPPQLKPLMAALDEIESLAGHDALDIEFAIDKNNIIHLLQVRPIAVDYAQWQVDDEEIHAEIEHAKKTFVSEQNSKKPFISGDTTIFSVMTDWNPAEIIGIRPNRLAFSLYRYLITDEIWALQRCQFGYKDVRPCPLIRQFAGHPYVDVRASFASFIPAEISDSVANRMVNHYLEHLRKHPYLHDKVELEIVPTCLSFDWPEQAKKLSQAFFTDDEIKLLRQGLQSITEAAFQRIFEEKKRLQILESRFRTICDAKLPPLHEAATLLEEAKKGTLIFSHMARMGFVAAAFLRSAIKRKLLAKDRYEAFMRSLKTVAYMLRDDAWQVKKGDITWPDFVKKYGHLRPGTYEISVPCYAMDPEKYLRPTVLEAASPDTSDFFWAEQEKSNLLGALQNLGLSVGWNEWELFLREAIEGREYSKFIFTKHLSRALENIALWGEGNEFSRDQLSHVAIEDILSARLGQSSCKAKNWLSKRIQEGKSLALLSSAVELPPFITSENDFDAFFWPDDHPNFIGAEMIAAPISVLLGKETENQELSLANRIVLIPQADPGYDWLFGHSPAGLITCYGGANSHMAIRAAEIGLPAAIGVGEKLYTNLSKAQIIRLDPAGKRIKIEVEQ